MSQSQKKFGIGIAGCGSISDTQAIVILQSGHATLAAVQCRSQLNLDRFSRKFDVPVYSENKKFLSPPGLDIAVICTPTGTHLEYDMAAAEAGKYILMSYCQTRSNTHIDL